LAVVGGGERSGGRGCCWGLMAVLGGGGLGVVKVRRGGLRGGGVGRVWVGGWVDLGNVAGGWIRLVLNSLRKLMGPVGRWFDWVIGG